MADNSFVNDFRDVFVHAVGFSNRQGLDKAIALSGGGISLAQLASLDHPYARRHGRPLLDPGVINRQTGDFQAAWKMEDPKIVADNVEATVKNEDWKADYLTQPKGWPKTKMFQRPIDKEVEQYIEDTLNKELNQRIKQLENKDYYI
jgi:hypothetical protein